MAYPVKPVDPALSPALAEIEKKTGPSNFLRVMAHQPEAMRSFAPLYSIVTGTKVLDSRLKEMIYLAVSFVNECDYCASHHIGTGRAAGLTDDEIREIEMENNRNFTPEEQAVLHYVRELTRTASADGGTRHAVEERFTPEQFVAITMIAGMANFTNRFNNGLSVPLEAGSAPLSTPAVG